LTPEDRADKIEAKASPELENKIIMNRERPAITPELCTDCGYCRLICPVDAITPLPSPRIMPECRGCLRCLRICPNAAIKVAK
jgi:MinD superfamily P-loop ATPase